MLNVRDSRRGGYENLKKPVSVSMSMQRGHESDLAEPLVANTIIRSIEHNGQGIGEHHTERLLLLIRITASSSNRESKTGEETHFVSLDELNLVFGELFRAIL